MRLITLTAFVLFLEIACNNTETKRSSSKQTLSGKFSNTITGYDLNCETVIQQLEISPDSFKYKRFCQTDTNRVFDSVSGFLRKTSKASFYLLNNDSTKEFGLQILTDSLVSFTIYPGQMGEFTSELNRNRK